MASSPVHARQEYRLVKFQYYGEITAISGERRMFVKITTLKDSFVTFKGKTHLILEPCQTPKMEQFAKIVNG